MSRVLFRLIVFSTVLGCAPNPPATMLPPLQLPADVDSIHPWIASLLSKKTGVVADAIKKRLKQDATPVTLGLIKSLDDFIPRRIEYSGGVGYVFCLKRSALQKSTIDVSDGFYFAEPPSPETLKDEALYFDDVARNSIMEFMSKFAGSGESKATAGQFVRSLKSVQTEFENKEVESFGRWNNSRILYHAQNGDSILLDSQGATAWHVFEVGEVFPLFDTFSKFVEHFATFRTTSGVFDSYSSFELAGGRPARR